MINILIAAVGGKGELLVSKIISTAAYNSNLDVKSFNKVGLSQRNGVIYSTIRIGSSPQEKILSAEVAPGCVDVLLGFEPLEAYRASNNMNSDGIIILSDYEIYPAYCIYEVEPYPENIKETLSSKYKVVPVNFDEISQLLVPSDCKENYRIRTIDEFIPRKMIDVEVYCIGILANLLEDIIPYSSWIISLQMNVPDYMLKEVTEAFNIGYDYFITKRR